MTEKHIRIDSRRRIQLSADMMEYLTLMVGDYVEMTPSVRGDRMFIVRKVPGPID